MRELSIIIPCYNEEKRIKLLLDELLNYNKKGLEIIFVDDGSTDKTKEILRSFIKNNRQAKILEHKVNMGKGAAVKTGFLSSAGKYLVFMDADGSTSPKEIDRILLGLEDYDIVVGSRIMPNSKIRKSQPIYRILLGKVFNRYVNLLFHLDILDTLCGFKGFRRNVAIKIFNEIEPSRWIFDVQILVHAKKERASVGQLGIEWSHKSGSKLAIFKNVPRMFMEVLKLYFDSRKQEYK